MYNNFWTIIQHGTSSILQQIFQFIIKDYDELFIKTLSIMHHFRMAFLTQFIGVFT
jgi:hypothetical protein